MQATIISVGSEIMRGSLLDTNSQYFAQELTAIGIEVIRISQAPDNLDALVSNLEQFLQISDVVVIAGGLGPTEDDLTREAVIALTGESPTIDEHTVDTIRRMFERRGVAMPDRNTKQAWTIPSATILPNHHGTAPGWLVDYDDALIAVLPGPPRENRPMWELQVRPALIRRSANNAIISRTIKTIGIGESSVADALAEVIACEWPEVGTYAKRDGVHIAVTAMHPNRQAAEAAVRATVKQVVELLEPHVYGIGEESLAAAVAQPLNAAGVKLAILEFGTAGTVSSLLLADPDAERAVARAEVLPGRVPQPDSESVERFATETARTRIRTHELGTLAVIALDLLPSNGAVSEGAVGLALAHPGGLQSASHRVHGTPDEMRRRAGLLAAEFLWRELRKAAGLHQGAA